MNDLRVGTVFILHSLYSNPKFNYNPKERYFIYLGKSSSIDDDGVIAILASPTTQTQYYESFGNRVKHPHVSFKGGEFGFTEDCVLDLTIIDYNMEYNYLINTPDVEIVGEISINKLKEIYNYICKPNKISLKNKFNIYDSFNNDGITGLTKPKRYKNRGRN